MRISHVETHDIVMKLLTEGKAEPNLGLIVDLAWIGTLVAEFAFQCPPEWRIEKKRQLANFLTVIEVETSPSWLLHAAKELEIPRDGGIRERGIGFEDLVIVRLVFRLRAARRQVPFEATLLAWIDETWGYGIDQRKIYAGERRGLVQEIHECAATLADRLIIQGVHNSLLPR